MKWNDDSDWDYNNWDTNQPNSKNELFVKLKTNGKWEDISDKDSNGDDILLPTVFKRKYSKPKINL